MNASISVTSMSVRSATSPAVLSACLGFFFSFRILSVLIAVRLFGVDPTVGVGAQLALGNLLFLAVIFHSVGDAPRTLRSSLRVPMVRWALLFLCVTGFSLLWSSTSSLPAAVAFWWAMATDSLMVVLLLRTGPLNVVINSVMSGYVWGACALALIAWLMPSQSDLRLGDEELLGPNQIGYVCAFAFFFAQYLAGNKSGNWRMHSVLLAVTLLRSLSKTTIAAFVIAEAFILVRHKSMSRKTKWLTVLAAAIVCVAFWNLFANYFDVYTSTGNQAETLTGRLGIWVYFLSEAVQKPWFGHGFHSVWKVIPPFGPDQFEARHAHNELLQQFYAYGAMGIVLLIGIFGSLLRKLRCLTPSPQKTLFLGLLLFVAVRGFADTESFDLSLPMWTIVMIGFLIEAQMRDGKVPA